MQNELNSIRVLLERQITSLDHMKETLDNLNDRMTSHIEEDFSSLEKRVDKIYSTRDVLVSVCVGILAVLPFSDRIIEFFGGVSHTKRDG